MGTGSRTVQSNDGVTLRVDVSGDGPPVVLLHGTLAGPSTFDRLCPYLDGHRLVRTELRGHGGDGVALPAGYGLTTTEVDDLVTILDEVGIERADLAGHSTGGAIAVACALRHPGRVGRLALVEPSLMSILQPPERVRLHEDFDPVVDAADRGDHEGALRRLLDATGGPSWAALPDDVRAKIVDRRRPLAGLAGPHTRALLAFDLTADDVVALAAPTLLVYGSDSMWFEAPIADRLRELRPDIPQVHVDGAGHAAHADRPDVVGPAIAELLANAR